jgi:alpha-tubulin suppressor-like RCC1 family protein
VPVQVRLAVPRRGTNISFVLFCLALFRLLASAMISDMKHMLTLKHTNGGFALPTVIIASVILLTVLVTSVTAVGSVTSSLANQYYNQLAREAAESGLAYARACLRQYNYVPSWTDAAPLMPNTGCAGEDLPSVSDWLVNSNNIRSAYTVPAPQVGTSSSIRVVSTGKVELTRASDPNQVWRTYSYVAAENSRYNDAPQIAGGAGWKGSGHNGYMLASTGVLYGWGDNAGNQLGDSSLGTTITTPTKIVLPDGVDRVKKVFNSGQGASILCIMATHSTLGDQLYCRGNEYLGGLTWSRFGLTGGLTATSKVDVNGYGNNSVCLVASDNQAYCAGINDSGNLGNAALTQDPIPITAPTKFRLDLASPGPVSGSAASLTVKEVFTKDRFTCVIASDNQAYCAGDNNYGQLGQSTTTMNVWIGKSIPGRALIPGNPVVDDIRLPYHSAAHSVFYHTVGSGVYMSGDNTQGTANDGSTSGTVYSTPRQITSGEYPKLISVGQEGDIQHSICVMNTSVYCMGKNAFGQIGLGACTARSSWVAVISIGGMQTTTSLNEEADYQMNSLMVITTGGDVYAAGDNTYGKLGTGAALAACNPNFAKVQLPVGVKATALANGDEYTAFILGDNGKVYAMGRNNNGQLGDGTTTDRSTPVEVKIPRQQTVY